MLRRYPAHPYFRYLLSFVLLCAVFTYLRVTPHVHAQDAPWLDPYSEMPNVVVADVEYSPWQEWAKRTADGVLDLNQCKTLQAGNANGDRYTDLICPYDEGDGKTMTFVQIAANGSFLPWQEWSGEDPLDLTGCNPLHAGDVNGDGYTDLICPFDYGDGSTATFVQTSTGSAYESWQLWTLRTGKGLFDLNRCKTLQVGDANEDGNIDLICPYDHGNESVATYVQLSKGTSFSEWQEWSERTDENEFDLNRCKELRAGHFNQDERIDLYCPYRLSDDSTVTYIQKSSGTEYSDWEPWSQRMIDGSINLNLCENLLVDDVNADRREDLICPYDWADDSRPSTYVQLAFGKSIAEWAEWTTRADSGPFSLRRCKDLYTGDVNRDGRADLICPYNYGNASTATFAQISSGKSFSVWQILSERTANGVLNLDRCKPLLIGTVNNGTSVDLICPYDFDDGSTATYVLASPEDSILFMPHIFKAKKTQ